MLHTPMIAAGALAALLTAGASGAQNIDPDAALPKTVEDREAISDVGPPPIGGSETMTEEKPLSETNAREELEAIVDGAEGRAVERIKN